MEVGGEWGWGCVSHSLHKDGVPAVRYARLAQLLCSNGEGSWVGNLNKNPVNIWPASQGGGAVEKIKKLRGEKRVRPEEKEKEWR